MLTWYLTNKLEYVIVLTMTKESKFIFINASFKAARASGSFPIVQNHHHQ